MKVVLRSLEGVSLKLPGKALDKKTNRDPAAQSDFEFATESTRKFTT